MRSYLERCCKIVDAALDQYLPKATDRPATIHHAMRYSLFAGGKRLRPVLCLAAAEACGGEETAALPAAAAVECLHTYTLIHDDLPCMDDDDLRRGKPTCHVEFGEGIAVLTGDALLTIAFEILAKTPPSSRYGVADYVIELATASGSRHLIGGQVVDLEGEGLDVVISPAQLRYLHESKTAALLACSLRLGAMSAGASAEQVESLTTYGQAMGLAFQIIDDILDVTQTSEKLGKSAGKDEAAAKSTYPALFGLEESRQEADRLTKKAHMALEPLGDRALRLHQIADFLLVREY